MSDSHRPRLPRPIAPAPGHSRDESPHLASSSRPAPPRRTSSDDNSLPARKHKTTACETCKQKKLKVRVLLFFYFFTSLSCCLHYRLVDSILTVLVSWWPSMQLLRCQWLQLPNRRVERHAPERCHRTQNRST